MHLYEIVANANTNIYKRYRNTSFYAYAVINNIDICNNTKRPFSSMHNTKAASDQFKLKLLDVSSVKYVCNYECFKFSLHYFSLVAITAIVGYVNHMFITLVNMQFISVILQIVNIGAVFKITPYRGKGVPSLLEPLDQNVS